MRIQFVNPPRRDFEVSGQTTIAWSERVSRTSAQAAEEDVVTSIRQDIEDAFPGAAIRTFNVQTRDLTPPPPARTPSRVQFVVR